MNTHKTFVHLSPELLQHGQSIRFFAHGMSMKPTIQHGDFVTVEPIEPSAVNWQKLNDKNSSTKH